jgi:hypothetical protein
MPNILCFIRSSKTLNMCVCIYMQICCHSNSLTSQRCLFLKPFAQWTTQSLVSKISNQSMRPAPTSFWSTLPFTAFATLESSMNLRNVLSNPGLARRTLTLHVFLRSRSSPRGVLILVLQQYRYAGNRVPRFRPRNLPDWRF